MGLSGNFSIAPSSGKPVRPGLAQAPVKASPGVRADRTLARATLPALQPDCMTLSTGVLAGVSQDEAQHRVLALYQDVFSAGSPHAVRSTPPPTETLPPLFVSQLSPARLDTLEYWIRAAFKARAQAEATLGARGEALAARYAAVGQTRARLKGNISLLDKVFRKSARDPQASPSLRWMAERIRDIQGFRLVLDSGSPDNVAAWMAFLLEDVAAGRLQIVQVSNYAGPGISPYLSPEQIARLESAVNRHRRKGAPPLVVKTGAEAVKSSGYTAVHFTLGYPDGTFAEWQVRGALLEQVANREHLAYDIGMEKRLSVQQAEQEAPQLRPLIRAIQALSPAARETYRAYLKACYAQARAQEFGGQFPMALPPLPPSLADRPVLALSLPPAAHRLAGPLARLPHAFSSFFRRFSA